MNKELEEVAERAPYFELVDKKAESNNTIDLDAYAKGVEDGVIWQAERILANNIDGLRDALQDDDLFFFYKDVIQHYGEAMAKWMQERMYSEEDMRKAFIAGGNSCIEEDDVYGSLYDAYMEDWFKQLKKK
jgi:hypothetical protein